MGIFAFQDVNPDFESAALKVPSCRYCESGLVQHPYKVSEWKGQEAEGEARFWVCPHCGWWHASADLDDADLAFRTGSSGTEWTLSGYGALRALDLRDISAPVQEVRDYLAAKSDQLGKLHPRLFELTVGSVFRDLGYKTYVTSYSADGGVDVVLMTPDEEFIGVQVKQTGRSIEAEQIRAFTGALFIGGYPRGVFVTASKFRRGATRTAELSATRELPVELVDAEGFFRLLGVAQRATNRVSDSWLEDRLRRLHVVKEEWFPWPHPMPT